MANYFDTGILLTAGFSLSSQAPLDGRSVVELLTDLDAHIAENRAYEGMCVYVKENKKIYIYNGTTWEEFVGGGSSEKQIKDWVSGSSYLEGDYIYHEGEIYRCLTSNSDVDFDETNWEQLTYGIDELSKEDVEGLLGLTKEEIEAMADLILDTEVRIDKTYSSFKIEERIDDKIDEKLADFTGGGGGASEAEFVFYDNESLPSVTNVEECLDAIIAKIYYVNPSVTSFTASPTGGVFEIGTVITAPIVFNWSYNKDITTQTLTDCPLADNTVRTATYDSNIISDKTFTLVANDGETSVTKSISYTFVSPYFTGVSATDTVTETDIIALTKKVEAKGNKTINYTTSQSHMIFAYPSSYNAIKSVIDQNGFNVTDSFTQNTVTVNGVNYYVYVSNKCSGSYNIKFNY